MAAKPSRLAILFVELALPAFSLLGAYLGVVCFEYRRSSDDYRGELADVAEYLYFGIVAGVVMGIVAIFVIRRKWMDRSSGNDLGGRVGSRDDTG